jgi:glutamyl-tRNA(Gln) amidotransferase subunit D
MKTLNLNSGDVVSLRTKSKTWKGRVLESHDSDVVLLKLDSGYNIGIRENSILSVNVEKKFQKEEKKEIKLPKNKQLPNVAMIITGGTISSRLDPKTGGVISTDKEEILKIVPEVSKICNIVKIKKPFMKWSENMGFSDWKKISELAADLLNDKNIDGLVITHGTDFLHYTASALAFSLKNLNKPVALTYSQRSIDRGSTDAYLNLLCAFKFATSDLAEIALVGHKDSADVSCLAMSPTKTRKLHATRRDAFKIVNDEPLAEITKGHLALMKEFKIKDVNKKVICDAKFSNKVALVKFVPGQDPKILDYYVNEGYKGIIIEAAGIGQVAGKGSSLSWIPTIKRLVKKGIVICAVPQTIYGRLNMNVYENGRMLEDTGIFNLKDMLSETAYVKLSWVLAHPSWVRDKDKVKEKMLENITGEFNEKIGFDSCDRV